MRAASLPIAPDAARGLRVVVVASRYHDGIVSALVEGAASAWRTLGGREEDLVRIDAPGAFELPVVAATAARRDDIDAVVCLGLVLAGETTHDRHIADSVANALQELALETGTPVAFGVLTCATLEQAQARCGGSKGNKGDEALRAAVGAVRSIRAVRALPRGGRA
jgi:6,7-dimethyl-8-ribityllumazine synthase